MADVGTLWVKIGADASELDRVLSGSKAELGKFASDMQTAGMRLAAVGAALTGPLLLGLKGAIDLGDQLDEMSQKTGVSTETLSKFSLAAKKNSVDLGGLATGFKFLAVRMTDALKAGSPQARMFADMGIAVADASGKLRPMEDVLLEVAERFSGMAGGAEKTNLAVKVFGRSGMELIPFLNMGKAGLKAAAEEAERLGIVFSGEASKGAAALADRMDEVKEALQGVFIQMSSSLAPTLNTVISLIRDVISVFVGLEKKFPVLTGVVGGFVLALGGILTVSGGVLIMLSQLIKSMNVLTLATGITTKAILLQTGALGLILAAGAGAYKIINDLREATDAYAEANERAIETETELNNRLYDTLVKTGKMGVDRFYELYDALGQSSAAMVMWIMKGKEGTEVEKAWAEHGKGRLKVINDQIAAQKNAIEAELAEKKYIEFLASAGILTFAELGKRVNELADWKARLSEQFKLGLIAASDYAKGLKAIDDQIKSLTETLATTTIPAARDLSNALLQVTDKTDKTQEALTDAEYWFNVLNDSMKITKATAWLFTAELIRLGAAARGIRLEEAFQPREIGKQTQEIQDLFAGLYNDIAMGFGNTFEEAASAFFNAFNFAAGKVGLTFELLTNLIKGLWEDVKRAFFRVIGEMVTRWVTDGVGKIIKETKDAGNVVTTTTGKMGSEFGAVGNIIIQVAKTIGTVITTLVTAIATAVTTLVTTIGTGIVTLATAIATAINILAAAAPALLEIGLVAAAIYTAFKAGEALVGGLSNLIGGGGGDNSDITYWLKPISERAQEMRDWLFINGQEHLLTIRQILGDISAKTQEVRDSINGGLIAVLNAILGVERDTYKALTATHTIHVIDDALLDSHRDVVASLAGIARAGLPSGLADSAGRGAMGLGGLADSALYKRAHAERHTFVYAPQVSAIDAAGVMKFVRGPMRDEFIRMVRDNSGGVTKALAVETGKYTAR